MKLRRFKVAALALLLTGGCVLLTLYYADEKFRESEALYTRVQASGCVTSFAAKVVFDAHRRTDSYPSDQKDFDELLKNMHIRPHAIMAMPRVTAAI